MLLKLVNAKAIKPTVIRFGIELWDNNQIVSEYELAKEVEKYITYPDSEDKSDIQFDVVSFQNDITSELSTLQFVAMIANRISNTGLQWQVNNGDGDVTQEDSDES